MISTPAHLSLYIHLPWCVKKCPYCDFNSHVYAAHQPNELPEQAYIHALQLDLQESLSLYPDLQKRSIHSVFFGGGTPSLFSGQAIGAILNHLTKQFNFASNCEITLEANPGTVERQHFTAYRKAGVNRLSLGIQSFDPAHLKKLGRIHDAKEAEQAIFIAREAGFDNLNLDIMYGLIEQSLPEALADLTKAISFTPEHISWYHLTLEPNTLFYKQCPPIPADHLIARLEPQGYALLEKAGYQRYEISAYAKKNKQAKHNLNYWQFGDYLGLGAGAHSKITQANQLYRLIKHKHPKTYLDCVNTSSSFIQQSNPILDQDKPLEFMMNALRLIDGVPLALFQERTGLTTKYIQKARLKAEALKLLSPHQEPVIDRIKPTEKGLLFLNNLVNLFSESL